MSKAYLRIRQVSARCGISRSTIYRLEAAGKFVRRSRLTEGKLVGWDADEVNAWCAARPRAIDRPIPPVVRKAIAGEP